MNKTTVMYLVAGVLLGYLASPLLDRVPVVNKLPKLG